MRLALLTLTALFCAGAATAQERQLPRFTFWGELQTRASVGLVDRADDNQERLGWGVRRARARFVLTLSDGLGANYDVDVASGSLQSVDLFAFYNATDNVRIRAGRMASAQPRAHIGTLLPFIDAVARPAIAERWGASTIGGDGRDFGLDVRYLTDELELSAFLHNGDGSFSTDRGNVRQEISGGSATGGVDRVAQAFSVYGAYWPLWYSRRRGGWLRELQHGGRPEHRPRIGRKHVHELRCARVLGRRPGSQPLRVKADAIGIRYEGAAPNGKDAFVGASLFGAIGIREVAEVFVRAEVLDTADRGSERFYTTGAGLSVSALRGLPYHEERFTLAYANGLPDTDDPVNQHLLVVQFQIVFKHRDSQERQLLLVSNTW